MTLLASHNLPDASGTAMSLPASARFAVHPRAAWRKVAGEFFVVTPDRSFHRLTTATAVTIFAALTTSPATQQELLAQVVSQFEVTPAQAEADLCDFLTTLLQRQVVSVSANVESDLALLPTGDKTLPQRAVDRGASRVT